MRGKLLGAAVLMTVALAVTACGGPGGTDGSLINAWQVMPEAKIPPPEVNKCYAVTGDVESTTRWENPLDCAQSHTVETFYVGEFSGEDAQRSSPPPSGGPGRAAAYKTCQTEAKTFVGDDWRTGRLSLFLITPTSTHWEVGARWFRCDLAEFTDLDNEDPISRTGSVKDGLSGERPLALGCATVTNTANAIDTMTPLACTATHNAEFAGIHEYPEGPWPADPRESRLAGCRGVIAAYAAIPNDKDFQYRTGQIASPFTRVEWELGNRSLRCWIWSSSKKWNKSLKGAGPSGLPINYA